MIRKSVNCLVTLSLMFFVFLFVYACSSDADYSAKIEDIDRNLLIKSVAESDVFYNPQNEMFRLLGTKRSFSQNETFFFSHPYPALFRLISHF